MSISLETPKPLTRSLTLRAAAAMALACAAGKAGQYLPYDAAQQIVNAGADLLFALGAIGVGVGRARVRQPLI
jgi:hypothetical protein